MNVLVPDSRYPSPSGSAVAPSEATSEPASGSVIANDAMARPWIAGSSQRLRIVSLDDSNIGTTPSAWSANTASASGEAAANASRTIQQARQPWSRIGWNQPAAPSWASSSRACRRAAASSLGRPAARGPAGARPRRLWAQEAARAGAWRNRSRAPPTSYACRREMRGPVRYRASDELGVALGAECLVSLAEVRSLHEPRLDFGLVRERRLEVECRLGVERLLRHAERGRGSPRQLLGDGPGFGQHLRLRDDTIVQADLIRTLGVHEVARQQHLGRMAVPDDARQQPGRAHVGAR